MKTLKSTTTLYFLLVVLSAAVLNPNPGALVPQAQEIISPILDKQADSITTHVIGGDYSVGYLFKPEVTGRITELRVRLPKNGSYKVSIWDIDSQTLITQTSVQQASGKWSSKEIPALEVTAQKTYAICLLLPIGTEYYNASNLNLPTNINNVRVLNSVAAFGDTYPIDLTMPSALFGLVDFAFETLP